MNWPDDADGDVLRRMEESNFDFSKEHYVEFNIDFDDWPPSEEAMTAVRQRYPDAVIQEPEDNMAGYVLFEVQGIVSYEFVIRIQREVSDLMAPFGGRCESWGVMQEDT